MKILFKHEHDVLSQLRFVKKQDILKLCKINLCQLQDGKPAKFDTALLKRLAKLINSRRMLLYFILRHPYIP